MTRARAVRLSMLAALAALLVWAPAASAHAVLQRTVPPQGTAVAHEPRTIAFVFNEPVEGSFGAVRVFDAAGQRVEQGEVLRPQGQRSVGVALRRGLPDGTYTATYRVISADSHPVSGGFVFSIGKGGAAPRETVADLIAKASAGTATEVAFGAVRGLQYTAIAIALGGLLFLLAVWLPALRAGAGAEERWRTSSVAFAGRWRTLALAAVGVGVLASALGIVLQGATGAGISFWAALDATVIREVLHTRFGTVWGLRLLDWLVLGAVVAMLGRTSTAPVLRPASVGASGLTLPPAPGAAAGVALALPATFLAISPALAGHASTQSPRALLIPLDVVHVVAMSAWLGGLALLVRAVPVATRHLAPPERTRLLSGALRRFSTVALLAVGALLATGVAQSIIHLRALSDLTSTAFGRAIFVKAGLLLVLIGFGAWNRRRGLPRLAQAAAAGEAPGAIGVALRRSLRAEVGLILVVLGVTSALVSYPPPDALSAGPYSTKATMGPLELQLTVDPARVGANQVHLYLFRARDGAQFRATKELRVAITQPDNGIGPIVVAAHQAGPGHYIAPGAVFGTKGTWRLTVTDRVSAFDEYETSVKVPVR